MAVSSNPGHLAFEKQKWMLCAQNCVNFHQGDWSVMYAALKGCVTLMAWTSASFLRVFGVFWGSSMVLGPD